MRKLPAATALAVALTLLQAACGGGGGGTQPGAALTGTLFGSPFVVRDALLVHPQTWKSADPGSTAVLVSDTPDLCAQITSARTTAPGRFLVVRLEQLDGSGAIVALTPGTFTKQPTATPAQYGDVYADAVDGSCTFSKLFTSSVQIDVTSIGLSGAPVSGTLTAQYSNGESVTGTFSVSATCDETAVDAWLNRNPTCG